MPVSGVSVWPVGLSSARSPGVRGHRRLPANMSLTLPFRGLSARSTLFSNPILVQTHSFVIPRKTREITRATDTVHDDTNIAAQAANNNRMGQITDILDNAALSHSPSSSNFSGKPLVAPAGQLFLTLRSRQPKLAQSLNAPGGEGSPKTSAYVSEHCLNFFFEWSSYPSQFSS